LIKPSENSNFFGGRLTKQVSMGANLRYDHASQFSYTHVPDSANLQKEDTVNTKSNNIFSQVELNLYTQIDVIQDVVTIYFDATPSLREAWTMWRIPSLNSYVKAGQMLLPYGLRIYDDNAFIRMTAGPGYNYSKTGIGGEIGIEPGPWSLIVNLTDKRLSSIATVIFRHFRFGGSFGRATEGHGGDLLGSDYTWGVFSGANFGRFTLLGEFDVSTRKNTTFKNEPITDRVSTFLEANVLLVTGVNFRIMSEFFDKNSKLFGNAHGVNYSNAGQVRNTVGIECFLTPFVQLGLFYRANQGVPDNGAFNQDEIQIRTLGFF